MIQVVQKSSAKKDKIDALKREIDMIAQHFSDYDTVCKALYATPTGSKLMANPAVHGGQAEKYVIDRRLINSFKPAIKNAILSLKSKFVEGSRNKKISKLSDQELALAIQNHTLAVAQDIMVTYGGGFGLYTGNLYMNMVASDNVKLMEDHKDPSPMKPLSYLSDQLVNYFKQANFGCGLIHIFPELSTDFARANGGAVAALSQSYGSPEALVAAFKAKIGQEVVLTSQELLSELQKFENAANLFDLVINQRIGSTTIVVTLFNLISNANGYQSTQNGYRYHFTLEMEKFFGQGTNTQWRKDNAVVSVTGFADKPKIMAKVIKFNMSGKEIVKAKPMKAIVKKNVGTIPQQSFVEQTQAVGDDWGIHLRMVMALLSLYVIPTTVLSPSDAAGAVDNKKRAQAVQATASILNQRHKELKNPKEANKSVMFPTGMSVSKRRVKKN